MAAMDASGFISSPQEEQPISQPRADETETNKTQIEFGPKIEKLQTEIASATTKIAELEKAKQAAEAARVELLLPTDHQVVDSYEPVKGQEILAKTIPIEFTNAGHAGMDIGVETVQHFANALKDAKTIIWNGPMGVFEEPPFDQGTIGIAHAVADAADRGATVIVGGGDSVAAVTRAGVAERITHISTGGGATLEFLGGEELPGVLALTDR